jgi:hypothetical protein
LTHALHLGFRPNQKPQLFIQFPRIWIKIESQKVISQSNWERALNINERVVINTHSHHQHPLLEQYTPAGILDQP